MKGIVWPKEERSRHGTGSGSQACCGEPEQLQRTDRIKTMASSVST